MSESGPNPKMVLGFKLDAAPDIQTFYSNFFRYRMTFNELGLTFSLMSDKPGQVGPMEITDQVQVLLPLAQAKSLKEYLTLLIDVFESEIGPIRATGNAPQKREVQAMIAAIRNLGTH